MKYKKYGSLLLISLIHGMKNYRVVIGLSFLLLTCLVIFAHLWQLAITKNHAPIFSPDQLLWYIALNEWVIFSIPDIQNEMEEELRSGRLAYLLPRPVSYLGAKFAEGVGSLLLYMFTLGPVAFLFTWYWTKSVPFSPGAYLIAVFLGFLAGVVGLIFKMLIGISAFWLQEVSPINWIWEKFLFMFGGLILPLTTYPLWMQSLALWTPFPSILGARSALALQFNPVDAMRIAVHLILWGAVAALCLCLVYRKGLRIINIQGG